MRPTITMSTLTSCTGNFDEFTLAVDKLVRNIVVLMYTHYIDL